MTHAPQAPRPESGMDRRTFLGVVGTGALMAPATARSVAASQADEVEEWLADAPNYDGDIMDERGSDEVTVMVGAGDGFSYDPPAVRVDPGTTVVWEWSGEGGGHDVVEDGGAFESELQTDEGATFEHTFEETGTYRYYCTPHESQGMKGAVVVGGNNSASGGGEEPTEEGSTESEASRTTVVGTAVAFLLVLLSPFGFWLREAYRE